MTDKKNILITGANGQLGNECKITAGKFPNYNCTFVTKEALSIIDKDAIDELFSLHHFDFCINCAAYTAVDKAESEKENAFEINATGTANLAAICKKYNAVLIHISTDYVFNGENADGYVEEDLTGPLNVYGETKLAGEKLAIAINPSTIVIRTSWVYSSFGKNFVKTMMKLMQEKEQLNVVCDQIGSPTYAADLAEVIFKIINCSNPVPGIYHYSNKGIISWYEFAQAIREIGNYPCKVNPIPSSDYPVPAKRPGFSILKTNKIESAFAIIIPNWKDSLKKCMALIK